MEVVAWGVVAKTHYDILGVKPAATAEQVRRAYYDKARQLHPDGHAGHPEVEASARRAMQDVNEAWRVLREPASRAGYDRAMRQRNAPAERPRAVQTRDDPDRPYGRRPPDSGELTTALVRALPWVAILLVLGGIVVFTAYARSGGSPQEIVGTCVSLKGGIPEQTPCGEPNDGRVVLIVDRESRCPSGSTASVVPGGEWYCLRPPESP
jgi:molecular chaperone DnaJ